MYNVLLADDEKTIRKGILSFIPWNALDCTVMCEASNGLEAKEYIDNNNIDIAILDIRMPGMSGLELSRYILEHYPDIRVIILTAFTDFSYVQLALRSAVVDYVIKTDYESDLPNAIEKAISFVKIRNNKTAYEQQYCKSYSSIVNQTKQFLNTYYRDKLTLDSIAEHVHINASYLCRIFKKETNASIIDTLNSIRIEKAKELLRNRDNKVSEVANQVGIYDAGYFTHVFSRYTGTSPKEYQIRFG